MDILSFTKKARLYDAEKRISLTSGAGRIGPLPVKE